MSLSQASLPTVPIEPGGSIVSPLRFQIARHALDLRAAKGTFAAAQHLESFGFPLSAALAILIEPVNRTGSILQFDCGAIKSREQH